MQRPIFAAIAGPVTLQAFDCSLVPSAVVSLLGGPAVRLQQQRAFLFLFLSARLRTSHCRILRTGDRDPQHSSLDPSRMTVACRGARNPLVVWLAHRSCQKPVVLRACGPLLLRHFHPVLLSSSVALSYSTVRNGVTTKRPESVPSTPPGPSQPQAQESGTRIKGSQRLSLGLLSTVSVYRSGAFSQ